MKYLILNATDSEYESTVDSNSTLPLLTSNKGDNAMYGISEKTITTLCKDLVGENVEETTETNYIEQLKDILDEE